VQMTTPSRIFWHSLIPHLTNHARSRFLVCKARSSGYRCGVGRISLLVHEAGEEGAFLRRLWVQRNSSAAALVTGWIERKGFAYTSGLVGIGGWSCGGAGGHSLCW
jgi:hypothetical protein